MCLEKVRGERYKNISRVSVRVRKGSETCAAKRVGTGVTERVTAKEKGSGRLCVRERVRKKEGGRLPPTSQHTHTNPNMH